MPRFSGSTHSLHWIYTPEKLFELKSKLHSKTSLQMREIMPTSPISLDLTREEETILHAGLLQTLTKVAQFFKFREGIVWTAGNYLKRFYLCNSLYEHDPMQMMFTALFLATKAEEVNINLRTICEAVKICEEKRVRVYEIHLLRGIKYHLQVFNPYRPLEALFRLLGSKLTSEMQVESRKFIEGILNTDWIFLETPGMLAVCGVIGVLRTREDLEEVVSSVLGACEVERSVQEVVQIADRVIEEVRRVGEVAGTAEQQFRSVMKKVQGVHKRIARGSAQPDPTSTS